jgi:hypothetical protein
VRFVRKLCIKNPEVGTESIRSRHSPSRTELQSLRIRSPDPTAVLGVVIRDCSVTTQESDETLDFNFNSANVVNKIIMKVLFYTASECIDFIQHKQHDFITGC